MSTSSSTSESDSKMMTDPVCGMSVCPEKTGRIVRYQGTAYYFCAEACRTVFEKDPQRYLQSMSPKRKGLWGRYLARLEKATGGNPIKCH